MRHRAIGLAIGVVFASCSVAPPANPPAREGTAGPVRWQVVDIWEEKRPQNNEIRWHYTVLLTETAGRPIRFERERISTYMGSAQIGTRELPFDRELAARQTLKFQLTNPCAPRPPGKARAALAVRPVNRPSAWRITMGSSAVTCTDSCGFP